MMRSVAPCSIPSLNANIQRLANRNSLAQGPRLVCFFASICEDTEVAQAMRQQMDLSCKLPRGDGPARVVLGSLDLSIGALSPSL